MSKINIINFEKSKYKFDSCLLFGFISLLSFSIVIVGSASIAVVERFKVSEFYFIFHHFVYLILSLIACSICTMIPIKYIQKFSIYAAIIGILLLVLVFVPGLSRNVNGAFRWISIGSISIQPSEIAKLLLIIYIAGYLVRKKDHIKYNASAFIVPLLILLSFDVLLLIEPDFGTVFIISCTVFSLLFIAGVKLRYLIMLSLLAGCVIFCLLFTSTYRLQRIIGFLNPWSDQFNKGYQLVQSLIAFGRGGWFGIGLGNSVQKLLYLPEAYTDFIFAILSEELGFIGALCTIILLSLIIFRGFKISQAALLFKKYFAGYLGLGISFWLALQSIVNIGVNIGLLPTKGLTLPFISYGGNSLLVCCIGVGLLFRIDFELRELQINVHNHKIKRSCGS